MTLGIKHDNDFMRAGPGVSPASPWARATPLHEATTPKKNFSSILKKKKKKKKQTNKQSATILGPTDMKQ
jgi:hypothetical protein